MKALMRGFGLALLAVAFWGLSGCGADNESEAQKLQTGQGAPPPTDAKPGNVAPQASSYDQYAKQQKELNSDPRNTEYSKAMNKKR